jgi:quercetin dioxygenase-like cupin family protein
LLFKLLLMENPVQNGVFQSGEEIAWDEVGGGIKRKIYGYDNQLMLVKMEFEKGAIGALHHHYHTQVSYVESGVFELTIGDEKKVLKQGDGYFVPADVVHGLLCLEPGALVEAFAPYRADLLQR